MEELENFEFAINKVKEAKERGLSLDDLLRELTLESIHYMPVVGGKEIQ